VHYEASTQPQLQATKLKQQQQNQTGLLKGVKQEKGVSLYLANIAVDEDSIDVICCKVKQYANQRGIRVMNIKAIRNHFCEDVIGCRITVPESHEHIALGENTWPHSVCCRKWEQRPSRNSRYNRYENYTSHNSYENDNSFYKNDPSTRYDRFDYGR